MQKKRNYPLSRRIIRFLKRQFRNPGKRLAIELAAVVAIIGIVIFMALSGQDIATDDVKDGIAYIEGLEAQDTAPIEEEVKNLRKEERKQALESGDLDVWSLFTDTVIMGDSRAVGFSYYGFVDENRVLASSGATIRNIEEYKDQLVNLNPSSIIFCYGLNDISIGLWDNVDAKWEAIPDWNDSIREHCEENAIPYIDITDTVREHSDLYDIDGIHMQKAFYEYWAIDMITEVTENE